MLNFVERQRQRLTYLEALYQLVGGSLFVAVAHEEIQRHATLSEEIAEDAYRYLLDEEFIKVKDLKGKVRITPRGVRVCEASLGSFKQKRSYFYSTNSEKTLQSGQIRESSYHYGVHQSTPVVLASQCDAHSSTKEKSRRKLTIRTLKGTLVKTVFDVVVRFLLDKLKIYK